MDTYTPEIQENNKVNNYIVMKFIHKDRGSRSAVDTL